MPRVPVFSTAINTVAYDPERRLLDVQYAGGKPTVYRYKGVPPEVFEEFQEAWVLGAFMNEKVKPFYSFERLDPLQAAADPLGEGSRTWTPPLEGGFTRARKKLQAKGFSRDQAWRTLGAEPPVWTATRSSRAGARGRGASRRRRGSRGSPRRA